MIIIYRIIYLELQDSFFTNRAYLKATFNRLLLKQGGERSKWEYPFAVAGINVSFMLIQMLDLQSGVSNDAVSPEEFRLYICFAYTRTFTSIGHTYTISVLLSTEIVFLLIVSQFYKF